MTRVGPAAGNQPSLHGFCQLTLFVETADPPQKFKPIGGTMGEQFGDTLSILGGKCLLHYIVVPTYSGDSDWRRIIRVQILRVM